MLGVVKSVLGNLQLPRQGNSSWILFLNLSLASYEEIWYTRDRKQKFLLRGQYVSFQMFSTPSLESNSTAKGLVVFIDSETDHGDKKPQKSRCNFRTTTTPLDFFWLFHVEWNESILLTSKFPTCFPLFISKLLPDRPLVPYRYFTSLREFPLE